jgi:hypothetical protein
MNRQKRFILLPIFMIAILALPLFRLFSPMQIKLALMVWLVSAIVVVVIMQIQYNQSILYALIGVLLGITLTIALISIIGLGQVKISPIEIQEAFSGNTNFRLSANSTFETKMSLFHSDLEPEPQWAYRAFYIKAQDSSGSQYFYVFQNRIAGSISTEVYSVSDLLWLFPF